MTGTTEESGQEVVKEESPAPKFTSPSADSQTNSQTIDQNALAEQVAKLLQPTIAKQVQSVKDKRFSELEKAKSNPTLDKLSAMGVTIPDNVRESMEMEMRFEALLISAQLFRLL